MPPRPHPARESRSVKSGTPQVGGIPEQTRLAAPLDDLIDFATEIFAAHGLPAVRARRSAEALCYGDVTGTPGCGLADLKRGYLPLLESGRARPNAEPLVIADRGATVLVDYRGALGLWAVGDAITSVGGTERYSRVSVTNHARYSALPPIIGVAMISGTS